MVKDRGVELPVSFFLRLEFRLRLRDEGGLPSEHYRHPFCRLPSTVYRLPSAVCLYRLPSNVYRLPFTVYLTNLSNASRSSASRNGSSSIVSRTSAAKAYVSS